MWFWFFKTIKIGYFVSANVIIALLLAKTLDQLFGDFNLQLEKKKYFYRSLFEMVFMLWLSGIVIYFFYTFLLRYFGHVINDARDFEANIFVFVLFFFQKTLKHKMQYIHDKMV
jgi:glycerol uptake facilitator-like aquaporin